MTIISDSTQAIEVSPGAVMGPLKLGMSRAEAFAALSLAMPAGAPSQENIPTNGLTLYYDDSGVLTIIEQNGVWPLTLNGEALFNISFLQATALLKSLDSNLTISSDLVSSVALGVGIATNGDVDQAPSLVAIFNPAPH